MSRNDFGLVLIVRDEEKVISRCLDSVLPLIDQYCICDTGSTDNTKQIITEYMDKHGIKGTLFNEEWVDFGTNKTILLKKAKETLDTKYIFWLDADEQYFKPDYKPITSETREQLLTFLNNNENNDIFGLNTHLGRLQYIRWQIIRNKPTVEYIWEYPFHEVLVAKNGNNNMCFVPFIINYAYNGNKDKTARYKWAITKFLEYLETHPNDSRATFYLAQTFQDAGNVTKAIEYYEKRYQITEGYNQERYISMLRAGRLYYNHELFDKALICFTKAIGICATRPEAFYELVNVYDKHYSQRQVAFEIAKLGLKLYNSGIRHLFFEMNSIHILKKDVAMLSWYNNEKNLGHELFSQLLSDNDTPEYIKRIAENNMKWFTTDLWLGVSNFKFTPTIMVYDNFLDNPDAVRNFALQQEFNVKGNYPGLRTKSFATELHKQYFEKILNKKITFWPDTYNGSFQCIYLPATTWWHRDRTDYSAMIYLSPEPIPNSGTSIYKHKKLGITFENATTQKELDLDSKNPDAWELVDKVGNKYNRLVLFNGRMSHRADEYFGSNLETGRLVQIFFFNAL